MSEQAFYRVSIKGIVIDNIGRILLAKEDNDKWEMLGGGLEHGEDPKECLAREVLEETGLSITAISERPLYFLTAPRQDNANFTANVIYEISLENLEFTPSDECQELRFFSAEDMKEVELFPNVQRLADILSNSQRVTDTD